MIRAIVVDDEPLAREGVARHLARHADLSLVAAHGHAGSALQGLDEDRPDLIFLDVEMPGLSGLSMIEALPAERRPLVVLLTAHPQFALQAFALRVLDYLLKPVDAQRFDDALDQVRLALPYRGPQAVPAAARPPRRFAVRCGDRLQWVAPAEVDWLQAQGDYVALKVQGREHLLRETLSGLLAQLGAGEFLRIHRSAAVRLDRVTELRLLASRDASVRLRDGTVLRASRTHVQGLIDAMAAREPD